MCVIGPSGAGKTTLLRLVAGLLTPSSGRIECGGQVWFDGRRSLEPERRGVGYVFQDYALFPHMNVRANVAYGAHAPVEPLLERLGILHLARARPRQLSGGERQRVALARALAHEPGLLLLDEPLSALDPDTRSALTGDLHRLLAGTGVPALIVTHSYEEAAGLAPHVIVLESGRVTQAGPARDLVERPASAFVARFAGLNYLEGRARGRTVTLDGDGGEVEAAEPAAGRVAVLIEPWEITLAEAAPEASSALNQLVATVSHVAITANRARVTLGPLVAEVTSRSAEQLGIAPGRRMVASWKATATRIRPIERIPGSEPEGRP